MMPVSQNAYYFIGMCMSPVGRQETLKPSSLADLLDWLLDEAFMRQKVFYLVQLLHIKWAGFISIVRNRHKDNEPDFETITHMVIL